MTAVIAGSEQEFRGFKDYFRHATGHTSEVFRVRRESDMRGVAFTEVVVIGTAPHKPGFHDLLAATQYRARMLSMARDVKTLDASFKERLNALSLWALIRMKFCGVK